MRAKLQEGLSRHGAGVRDLGVLIGPVFAAPLSTHCCGEASPFGILPGPSTFSPALLGTREDHCLLFLVSLPL
jgi:hypothetical protein